jgi:hypothetical protein
MSQRLLEGQQQEYVEDESVIEPWAERIGELEDRVEQLEASIPKIKRDAVVALLSLLNDSLRHIASGNMDIPDVSQVPSTGGQESKWAAIKQRHPGNVARAIDILLIQGTMSTDQLRTVLRIGYETCRVNVVNKMVKMGLIIKNGSQFSLKPL